MLSCRYLGWIRKTLKALNDTYHQDFSDTKSAIEQNVLGREPWSSGYGWWLMFKRSWVWIPAPYTGWKFFTLICCKNWIVCLKRPKINKKRPGLACLICLSSWCAQLTEWANKVPPLLLLGKYLVPACNQKFWRKSTSSQKIKKFKKQFVLRQTVALLVLEKFYNFLQWDTLNLQLITTS